MDGGNGLVHGQEDGNKTGRHGQSSRGWLVGWSDGWMKEMKTWTIVSPLWPYMFSVS